MDEGNIASLERVIKELRKVTLDAVKELDETIEVIKGSKSRYDTHKSVRADAPTRSHQVPTFTKGYMAKETLTIGHGIKVYENVVTEPELSKYIYILNELRVAGRNGKLPGETFGSYNHPTINKREFIQFGVPMFEQIKVDETNQSPTSMAKGYIDPIPPLLQKLADRPVAWNWVPANKKPNGCIINFFDEGEYSHPFVKPPHLEQPIYTVILPESRMAFGYNIVGDGRGYYRNSVQLSLKQGSLFVMNGYDSNAMYAMCASPNKRIIITFFKVPG